MLSVVGVEILTAVTSAFSAAWKRFSEFVGSDPRTAVDFERRSDLNEINSAACISHVGQCCVSVTLIWSLQQPIASGVP